VTPAVISSADHVLGTRRLAHSACTVIKINGDYLDTRIKNTPEELANYDDPLNRLLRYQANTLMKDLIRNTPFAITGIPGVINPLKPALNAFGEPVRLHGNGSLISRQ
jgi:hypothetical protein